MPCADCLPGAMEPVSRRFSLRQSECPGGGGIRCSLRAMWRGYWRSRAERATVFMLQSLGDRTLKDLGIDRTEVESVVYCADDRRRGM